MEAITFIYTRARQDATKWDLNLKFVSSQGDIFYTSRLFFCQSKYFQILFVSGFKENYNNTITLNITTTTLEKYFLILKGEADKLTFSDQELVDLIEIGDQEDLKVVVEYLIDPIIKREMISAEDFFRLVEDYDLQVDLEVDNLIHLEGISNYLDQLEEPMVWDCFDLVCSNLYHCKVYKQESKIELEEYKRIALACYDRFPDKAEMFRDHTKKYLGASPKIPNKNYDVLHSKLKEAGLFCREITFDFRKELEASLDIIINFFTC